MNTFNAKSLGDNHIILNNSKDLAEVYKLIGKDEDFIVSWKVNGKSTSQVVVSNAISAKVKTGAVILRSEDE